MKQIFGALGEVLSMSEFLKAQCQLKASLYWQAMKTVNWRHPPGELRPLHLSGEARVDGTEEPVEANLLVDFIGGHNGLHAFLYLDGKLIMESSDRTDEVEGDEAEAQKAPRDLHTQAQTLFGEDLNKLYKGLFPFDIYKEESRKVLERLTDYLRE